MQFEITRVADCFFVVRAPEGQLIRPAAIHEVVLQLQQGFHIDPHGIRFFWPDDDQIDMVVAVLRSGLARPHPSK